MIPATPVSWWAAAPVLLVTVAVLFGPGAVAVRLLGQRWFVASAVAPALSVGTITVAGVAASTAGLRWSPLVFLAAVVTLWALAGMLRLLLRRRSRGPYRPVVVPWGPLGVLLGAVGVAAVYLPGSGTASEFPQQPDTIFHLGVIAWMTEHADLSTMHASGFSTGSGTGFYPAGFHDVAVVVAQLSGGTGAVAASCVALVVAAVVWPVGSVLLARLLLGRGRVVAVCAGLVGAAFTGFPFWLMGYGVLWPNLLGYAMLPASLAVLVLAVHAGRWDTDRLASTLLFVAGLPGLALAHPNALVAVAVLSAVVLLERTLMAVVAAARDRRAGRAVTMTGVLLLGLAGLGGGWAGLTIRAVAMRTSNPPGPEMSLRRAVFETVTFSPRVGPPLWALTVLALIGTLVLLGRAARRWVVVAAALVGVLWVIVAGVDNDTTRWFTWPWYNNSPRLGALLAVLGAPLATAGLVWLAGRRPRRVGPARWWPVAVPLVFVLATGGLSHAVHQEMVRVYFNPPIESSWAGELDLAALRTLSHHIGADDVTAANPWKGATYLYLVSGRRLLLPTEKARAAGDRDLLARRLDKVASSPEVCAAARRQHVRYVITGGTPVVYGSGRAPLSYGGIDRVAPSGDFREVAQAGPFTLLEITRCAG